MPQELAVSANSSYIVADIASASSAVWVTLLDVLGQNTTFTEQLIINAYNNASTDGDILGSSTISAGASSSIFATGSIVIAYPIAGQLTLKFVAVVSIVIMQRVFYLT